MKQLKNTEELIEHMKNKGITFNYVSEEDAADFLRNHNYYLKLASYRSNYEKHEEGSNKGKYINLDFAYLKELSLIDRDIRYFIVEMCLDIEHEIKVKLLQHIETNEAEDGYEIVKKFLAHDKNLKILSSINSHKSGVYCRELIEKYYPYFPAWVFVEVISFGTLLYFCQFYEQTYNVKIINNDLMNNVRDLRNASAHSNCLLNHLNQKMDLTKQANAEITEFLIALNISKSSRRSNLRNMFTYNIINLLYVYDVLMPDDSKIKRYEKLHEFLTGRALENKEYFKSNQIITGTYNFIEKVVSAMQANLTSIAR